MNDRGFAMPLAIVVLVILGLVGAAAAFITAGDMRVSELYSTSNRVAAAASAGIEHGAWQYRDRVNAYKSSDGDEAAFVLANAWPLQGDISGHDYEVTMARDSFDFDADGNPEAVSCKPGNSGNGNGNDGDNGNNGNGNNSSNKGNASQDDTQYWEDGSGSDKDGDGELGLSGGHFDVDVWDGSQKRKYHKHEFDNKYDTDAVDLRLDPNLLWEDLVPANQGKVRVEFLNDKSAVGTFSILEGATEWAGDTRDGLDQVIDASQISKFRLRFEGLQGFACSDPGSVDKDKGTRDLAFNVRIYDDASGALIYEHAVYWHNKADDCTLEDESGSGQDSGSGSEPAQQDQKKADDLCNQYDKAVKDAQAHEQKMTAFESNAKDHEQKAADYEAKGDTKKADKEYKLADEQWDKYWDEKDKADEDWAAAASFCEEAKQYGDCNCSTGSDTSSNDSGGNSGGNTCTLNGDGDGWPVFVMTSTATRGAFRATQRLWITSLENSKKTVRLAWQAD